MPQETTKRCVIYARISVASEKSVSIERQINKCQDQAAARDWEVVGVYKDEGVSATYNQPETRDGWQALMASPEPFDVVLVWKIDRLARKTLDFLRVDETLQKRGAGIVAVEQPIDMTTATGRAFATLLAVFAQMEAEAISDRVAGARQYLLRAGRVVGGKVPYGWRSVPNPHGKGLVHVQDDKRIGYVKGMVERTLSGHSIYSTACWLDEQGAPTPTKRSSKWSYSTVERILRHPILAGLTPYNPGNSGKVRGDDVVRDADGLPEVVPGLGIMSLADWRKMVARLDDESLAPQRKPRAMRAKTSGVLSGLVVCGEHDEPVRMWRGTAQGRHGYYCPECHQMLTNFEDVVVEEFLYQKGEHVRWSVVREVREGGSERLPEIEYRIREVAEQYALADDAQADALGDELKRLRDLRREALAEPATVEYVPVRHTQTFGEDWAAAADDEARRVVLGDALEQLVVRRGRPGRRTREGLLARLRFDWRVPEHVGPIPEPDDETLAEWAEYNPVPSRRAK